VQKIPRATSTTQLAKVNRYAEKLNELEYFRVTGLQEYENCPKKWAAERLFETGKQVSSKYAAIGTAVHAIIESHFKGEYAVRESQIKYMADAGVDAEEITKCFRYIDLLSKERLQVGHLEMEFTLPLIPVEGAKPVRGHLDFVGIQDDILTIVDHKTNRTFEPVDVWKKKLQTRLYSMALRQLWKDHGVNEIRFIIGYVNLGTFVRWSTTAEDDVETAERITKIWNEIVEYTEKKEFEARLNDTCQYCSLTKVCDLFQNNVVKFQDSAASLMLGMDDFQRYDLLKMVADLASKEADKLKPTLVQEVQAAGGTIARHGKVFELTQGQRRSVEFTPLFDALMQHAQENPQFYASVREFYGDLFSAKVGGVDELLKHFPELTKQIEALITVNTNQPSISIKSIGSTKKITK
jgi:CRISPR/Cas system-associated exonuclease Cas4 (RecB family)